MSIAATSHRFASSSVSSARPVPARPASTRGHLHLTRRGRGVLLTIVAAPLVAIALFAGLNAGGATATSSSTPLSTVTVASGQSLWQLARHIAPNADPRDVISDIIDVNQLASADVYPGEQLEIPAQYSH
jgi:LysM repeat protein